MAVHAQTWQPKPSSTWSSSSDRDSLSVPNLSVPGLDQDRQPSPTSLRGRLQSLRRATSPARSKTSQSPDGAKGALGLTLLHEPSEPRVDFIFVHGLNGGSRRSWSASSSDPSTFWPKEWLPSEPGFRHVRIHSFGYDSDWTKSQQSSLTIHDFGQALLADLYNAPGLKRNGNTPIVLVAHSMGGLVVKKAYLLARRDPIYADIASRIHSLYFLGTPHRGADSSAFVTTLISMSIGSGSKAFVKELVPGSGTIQAINDEFRHVCNDVRLWSFFEGVPTSTGPTNTMIVEKESAVMGLPGEHTQYLQADHRRLVKFESTEDPNYNILLRCFNTTIEEIEKDFVADKSETHRAQMKQLAQAFDVAERPDGDFLRMLDKLHDGSCEWLTGHPSFRDWLECDLLDANPAIKAITSGPATRTTPRFFWLNGPPGSGKSVASGHVIKHLTSVNLDCAYFYFKNSDKTSLTQFLLSMALQMAETSFQIRHTFLAMMDEGETIDSHGDHVMVWNTLFLGRIFKLALAQPQYWVIDALDECPPRLLASLITMFARIEPTVPLRIFFTSRPSGNVERLLNQERIMRVEMQTGQAESLRDIDAFVRSRLSPDIIQDFNEEDGDLVAEIIDKSNGIFLWASLIMTRLDEAHSIEAMRTTLDQVPSEMSGMYSGILASIADSPNADLAHCVLRWVVCAKRPLTTEELREAVRLDINQTLRTADRFAQVCGSLITVDNNLVQVMHQTVKEFLTGEQSDFYIPRSWSHARIAELCLHHLNSRNFAPPRTRRGPSPSSSTTTDPSHQLPSTTFDTYAATTFSYHLAHCSPSETTLPLLPLLRTFLTTNLPTWLAHPAQTASRLSLLTRALQHLKAYLTRQVATSSPLDADYAIAARFTSDLARLGAIYGPHLLHTPASVFALIPLLCPRGSVVHWAFARGMKQRVLCAFNEAWDERLTSFSFGARVMSIACAESFFAVGLGDGTVRVYRQSTFGLMEVVRHGEPVRRLANGNISGVLVSAGLRTVRVWGVRRELLWEATVPEQPLSVRFSPDDGKLYVPLRNGEVWVYRVKSGVRMEALGILEEGGSSSSSDEDEERGVTQKRTMPMLIRISPMLGIAAIAYRSSHLQLSYYGSDERVEAFVKEGYEDGGGMPPQVLDVAFNENAEQNLMAVAYQDGDLVTLDPWTLQQKQSCHLNAHTLAASPDGHTLAAGDSECVISLFAFDGLRLLCRIESLEERIMGIVFASNSLRFFDLRGNTCNVWEPAVLVKKNLADDSSSEESDDYLAPPSNLVCTRTFEGSRAITAMAQAGDTAYLFCGREDGSITVHDTASGRVCAELKFHARMVDIRHLAWNATAKVLFSVDASRRCMATKISLPPAATTATTAVQKQQQQLQLQQVTHLLDFRASDTVLQALISPDASTFLVSTQSGEELHAAPSTTTPTEATSLLAESTHSQSKARWLPHPISSAHLLLFTNEGTTLHLFHWADLSRLTPSQGIKLVLPAPFASLPLPDDEWHSRSGLATLFQTAVMPSSDRNQQQTVFLTLDLSALDLKPEAAVPAKLTITPTPRRLISPVRSVLGVHKSSLFFLSARGWVCSIGVKNLAGSGGGSKVGSTALATTRGKDKDKEKEKGYYTRHFFIPSVWQTGGEVMARVVSKGTVAMVYRDEVVVFQGFLEFEEKCAFGGGEKELGNESEGGNQGEGGGVVVPVIRTED
ncbi:hypothetical protein C8A05DRAFT_36046 [Staphylotrichum tortipilum]|uniref:GPI inositol-deacylase n=1 Tax=Staphylotrichum tortipilum TaxID=2831512 RepID=A0AAN6RRP2_9PEZI|nr:hypothetical protein C8A05DRAFT_36046 [Staphylotrichum longicolle]